MNIIINGTGFPFTAHSQSFKVFSFLLLLLFFFFISYIFFISISEEAVALNCAFMISGKETTNSLRWAHVIVLSIFFPGSRFSVGCKGVGDVMQSMVFTFLLSITGDLPEL